MAELKITPVDKEVVVTVNGVEIVRTRHALSLKEGAYKPVTYFPRDDIRMDCLSATEKTTHCPHKGDAVYWDVEAGSKLSENAAWSYEDPKPGAAAIEGYIAFYPSICTMTEH